MLWASLVAQMVKNLPTIWETWFHSTTTFISQNLLGDDVHETSRLCTVFTGTGTGAQGTFHPLPRGDFSLVYSCCSLITRLCLTLFYPMDWTDCSVHGIAKKLDMTWRLHHHHYMDHLAAAGERGSRQMFPWNSGQEKLLSGSWHTLRNVGVR